MNEVKWIKIVTDIFDDEKMLLIDGMPERDGILVIWFKLLCLAGKQNNCGLLTLTDRIAYTDEMLSQVFRRPLNTVRLALETFEQFGMIEIINDTIAISNWEKHQNQDAMDKIREQNRQRVAKYRNKQKSTLEISENDKCNVTVTLPVTLRNATDIDIDKDIDNIEDNKLSSLSKNECFDKKYTSKDIVDLYHDICKSYPKVKALSEKRKTAIKLRLKNYGYDAIKEVFTKAEASDFLKGKNNRNWTASFDWLIVSDNNFCKVLDGNYDNGRIGKVGNNQQYNQRTSERDVDCSWINSTKL